MKKQRIVSWFLSLFLLFPLLSFSAFSEPSLCPLCEELEERGFPASYRDALCALWICHPNWEFEALPVTELSGNIGEAYSFSYVLDQEWSEQGRSLVSAGEDFAPYWGNTEKIYDSGFYVANREAVAYFLDPRNFLSEQGIFQFLLLSGEGEFHAETVSAVLEGSAAESLLSGYEGGIGGFLVNLGEEWNLNPLHLASRLRQEQGSEGNVLLWGTAGSFLKGDGESLDGYFNPFNISASGDGEREIYRTGALYAKKMGWDTLEKGLAGGAEKLAEEYVKAYQNTLYLQKWNVDARSQTDSGSRNFWAQFMQNIGGAKTEGELLCAAISPTGEEELSFLIPVYEGMPETPCPDPAAGECAVFAAVPPPVSSHLIPLAEEVLSTEAKGETVRENVAQAAEEKALSVKKELFYASPLLALIAAFFPLLWGKTEKKREELSKNS